jgi:hypothetical protein
MWQMKISQNFSILKFQRVLWWLTLLWGGSIIWLAERPPMSDLPVHAGQIALLKDLLLGNSPWSDTVFINPITPYLLGYCLATLFSFVMPVLVAVKLTLSLAYFGFVLIAVKVGRHFGSSDYLDWMMLPVFFGLSFVWGFFSFLVAAPVGLIFILVADYSVSKSTINHRWLVIWIGLILLFSHGLSFAFFWSTAFVMIIVKCRADGFRRLATALVPLLIVAGIALIVLWMMKQDEQQLGQGLSTSILFNYHWGRLYELLTNSFDSHLSDINGREYDWKYLTVASLFLSAPWLIGLRPIKSNYSVAMIPLAVVLAVSALVPTDVSGTWLLWERFALFLFPSYAWIFSSTRSRDVTAWRVHSGVVVLILGCWFAMGVRTIRTVRFDQESGSFSRVLATLDPAQRVLYFAFDKHSVANAHDYTYLHFASWYEAELHGFADPSLAYYHNMVVRFRRGRKPKLPANFERNPGMFDWNAYQGDQYRYFIIRDKAQGSPSNYFKGSLCLPQKIVSDGEWQVYERTLCNQELKDQ